MKFSRESDLPVFKMLFNASKKEKVSFHMPGHNKLKAYPKSIRKKLVSLDTTEINITDDLNSPKQNGPFFLAQERAASVFGSSKTFFITTGASTSVHAAIFSLSSPNDKIVAFNNSHKSLINACIMHNLKLVLTNEEMLSQTLSNNSDAKLLFITYPDYNGKCLNLEKIVSIAHEYKLKIIVDESHGTHLPFAKNLLPKSALFSNVDLVIHSAHKTTPALTQGAFLHITDFLSKSLSPEEYDNLSDRIKSNLRLISTSSPSFPIAASLDYSIFYLEHYANKKLNYLYKNIRNFINSLPSDLERIIPEQYMFSIFENPNKAFIDYDFTKLTLDFSSYGISPKLVNDHLESDGIFAEFYDTKSIVLLCNMENTKRDFLLLLKSLKIFLKKNKSVFNVPVQDNISKTTSQTENFMNLNLNKTFDFSNFKNRGSSYEYTPIDFCENKLSADFVTPYPPGIPLLLPGQVILPGFTKLIVSLLNAQVSINGVYKRQELNVNLSDTNFLYYIKTIKRV